VVSGDGRGLSFGNVADLYDRFRPGPPYEAADLLGDLQGCQVLEVGAGTGKLTRFLLSLGARVSVIEPDEQMRSVLVRRSPSVRVLSGRAEAVDADDASFDVAISSSAWHWFDQPDATDEMARVLRDGAMLHVWWNGLSRDVGWINELTQLREREGDSFKRPRGWRAEFELDGPFIDPHHFSLHWEWPRTPDEVVELFSTYSGAFVRSVGERATMANQVRERLREHESGGVVVLPMTLRGTSARRRPRS
jgi:SAM-dependent methyltransferase